MSTTPPPRHRRQQSTASSLAETPNTPDTPYHSVRESNTGGQTADTSDFSDDGSVDHFSDATEGRSRTSLEEQFGPETLPTPPQTLQTLGFQEEDDEDADGSHTPHVEKPPIVFPVPPLETLADTMSSEETGVHHSGIPEDGTADSQKTPSVPLLVVDKTHDDHPVYGTVEGSEAYTKRSMDAQPDILEEYEDTTLTNGHPNPKASPSGSISGLPAPGPSEGDLGIPPLSSTAAVPEPTEEDGGFDDDFDDFGETVEGGDGFDDFGDFDEAEPTQAETSFAEAPTYYQEPQRPVRSHNTLCGPYNPWAFNFYNILVKPAYC
ncbi:hypothetical protein ABW19_dt0201663 [Dactylella cylindrospora]|nr:hypothetical protein ABW19_dt0201663 [Dactylella cylindrospora]